MTKKEESLPDVILTNLHKRFSGVSATVLALLPKQRKSKNVGVLDAGQLNLQGDVNLSQLLKAWKRPKLCRFRIWHARRDNEVFLGLVLRSVFRQKWKVVFTFAGSRRPNLKLSILLRLCDAVIVTSKNSAKALGSYTEIIHHGVDLDKFIPAEDKVKLLEGTEFEGKKVIGVFGRVRSSKGVDLFVQAMVNILPRYPDHVAVILGLCKLQDMSFQQAMQKQIQQAGLENRIVFLGHVSQEEKHIWFQRVCLCVAASRTEGFGLTPIEAFASGSAVVTSRAGIWPLVVDDEVGKLSETGNVQSLMTAIESLLCDSEKLDEMGKQARIRAIEKHSIEQEVMGIHKIYDHLMVGESIPRKKA